jgi:hypothetical protein
MRRFMRVTSVGVVTVVVMTPFRTSAAESDEDEEAGESRAKVHHPRDRSSSEGR